MFLHSLLLCCFASFSAFLHANEYTLRLDKINSAEYQNCLEYSRLAVKIMKENGQRLAQEENVALVYFGGVYKALVLVDIQAKQDGSCTIAHKLLTKKAVGHKIVMEEWVLQGRDLVVRNPAWRINDEWQSFNIRTVDMMKETDFWKAVSENEGYNLAQIKQNYWLQHFKQNDRCYYVHQVWASSPETDIHNYYIAIDMWPEPSTQPSLQQGL